MAVFDSNGNDDEGFLPVQRIVLLSFEGLENTTYDVGPINY